MAAPYAPYDFPNFALEPGYPTAGTPTFGSTSMNTTTNKVAWAFSVPGAVNTPITKVLFRYNTRTGTPPTYRASLQSLDASGNPDGTVLGGGSPASVTFTPPADTSWNATTQVLTLDNSYLATPGQILSIVIDYSSGTVDASNFSSINRNTDSWTNTVRLAWPHSTAYTSGSWGSTTSVYPVWGYGTSDGRYWGFPQQNLFAQNLGTNGYRAAMRFVAPAGCCDWFSFSGIRLSMTAPTAGAYTFKVGLWNQAGVEMASSGSIDSDVPISGTARYNVYSFTGSPPVLYPGVPYYLGLERTNRSCDLYGVAVDQADYMSAMNGPDDLTLATWDGSAWTQVPTSRPAVEPTNVYIHNRRRLRGGRLGEVH